MKEITLIPGDGIGPEVIAAAKRCIDATGVKITWETVSGFHSMVESIKENKIALKGPITTPIGKGFRSLNVGLRQTLDLYANVRPAKYYPGVKSLFKDVDLVVIRENTEGLYAGIEYAKGKADTKKLISFVKKTLQKEIRSDSGISLKLTSVMASRRIVEFAFQYAKKNKRKKVTAVHKANILKYSDGLFMRVADQVAKKYKISFEQKLVDNMCMQLVQKPHLYDVLVLPNLYGDIVSDLCAGLVGGLGVAPSGNFGEKYAVFEPVHGSAPKYAGKNKVNPTATILAGVMLLRHIKEEKAADKLERAVVKVIKAGKKVTYDLGGKAGTKQMADEVIRLL